MHSSSRTTTPPAENSPPMSEDIARERGRVMHGELAPALRQRARALEHGEEAAGRLARGPGELRDVGLGYRQQHVAVAGAFVLGLFDQLGEDGGDAALHGLEGLRGKALVGGAQAAAERDYELDRKLRMLA